MKLEQSLVNLFHGENSNSSVEDTGLGGCLYFSGFIFCVYTKYCRSCYAKSKENASNMYQGSRRFSQSSGELQKGVNSCFCGLSSSLRVSEDLTLGLFSLEYQLKELLGW